MTTEVYKTIAFREPTFRMIAQALAIIDEYQAAGFILTLRQLFYQFVARKLISNKLARRPTSPATAARRG
jgi:hypothetical protein